MIRPVGVSPGAIALAAAWAAALTIAMLTGAAAVVILLAAGVVGCVAAAVAGGLAVRSVVIGAVVTGDVSVVGDHLRWHVSARASVPVRGELRVGGDVVASGIVIDGENVLNGVSPRRGVHTEVEARWSSAGLFGLVWWRQHAFVPISPLSVAPMIAATGAAVDRFAAATAGDTRSASHPGRDQLDGVRPWRDGDEVNSVHWPSSLRSGELIMRQQYRDADEQWTVRAQSGTGDSNRETARVRRSMEDGLRARAEVAVRIDGGEPQPIATWPEIARWCAEFESEIEPSSPIRWWRRAMRVHAAEPETELSTRARWFVAAAGAPPLLMLLTPLGYGIPQVAIVLAATATAAVVSCRAGNRFRTIRQLAGLAAAGSVAASLIDFTQITSVATSLRFFLPQALVALVVLQGFECNDRRAARVSLACAALLTAYSAAVRVDDRLGMWLVVAAVSLTWALAEVTRPDRLAGTAPFAALRTKIRRRVVVWRLAGLLTAAVATLAILAVVPIPRGPTQLTLPTWLEQRRPTNSDGALASPDGSPLLGEPSRGGGPSIGSAARSSAGSYSGFSPTMDTSLRGDLGDEVVLRVRAPYPDFWRGQTYSNFDGRAWSVDNQLGTRSEGPDHSVEPALGDIEGTGDEFVQTFYAEVDLPNLIFAATSVRRVLLDAPLWQRSDGALRAGVVIPAGSAYTVVSERSRPTATFLRYDGDISEYGSPPEYLQLPDSTTGRVRDLAQQLAADSPSTYDTVRAIESWLGENVAYDLEAPVPHEGVDAVDDFLFESRRGFCEQIATATAVMLRSLGVPARVATGYVPSGRDEVAGVWISRARDAHAWVEVHFPSFGWVAFDPTAAVPLSGEAGEATIGGDLVDAIRGWVDGHIGTLIGGVIASALFLVTVGSVRRWRDRRRRGRWGVLQDRFVAVAVRRGAPRTSSNAELAAVFDTAPADAVAQMLDSSAFAASWIDDDDGFEQTAAAIRVLEAAGDRHGSPVKC